VKFPIPEIPRNGGSRGCSLRTARRAAARSILVLPVSLHGNGRLAKIENKMNLEDTNTVADWIGSLANWQTFFTGTVSPNYFTHRDGTSDFSMISCRALQKGYEHFMRTNFKGVSYVVAYEPHKDGHGFHCHSLLSDVYGMRYKNGMMWTKWKERFGRNKTEGIEHPANVRSYVSKYISKEWNQNEKRETFPYQPRGINHLQEVWWDVKIKRQMEFHGTSRPTQRRGVSRSQKAAMA
jgi:hypothetical protein